MDTKHTLQARTKSLAFVLTLLFTVWLIVLNPNRSHAQQLPRDKELAARYFSEFNYARAAIYYERLLSKKTFSPIYIRRLIDCYQHLRNYAQWSAWASKAVALKDATAEDHYYYGLALQAFANYDSARVEFIKSRGNTLVSRELLENYITSCDWAKAQVDQTPGFTVDTANRYNSPAADFSPALYNKDSILFTSDRPLPGKDPKHEANPDNPDNYGWTGNEYLSLFVVPANKDAASKGPLELFIPSHDGREHSGPAVINHAGTRLYFTRTVRMQAVKPLNTGVDQKDSLRYFRTVVAEKKEKFYDLKIRYIKRLEIWYSDKVNGKWQQPKPFPFNDAHYSVAHPALSADEKSLYFTSDMPGGKGGFDLYSSQIEQDTAFKKPQNLTDLNTAGDDEFPSIASDQKLYFASNGRPGYGGLDIFQAQGTTTTQFTAITNMGQPANSPKDDFGFLVTDTSSSTQGYLSSNRSGGKGSDDLYSFNLIKPVIQPKTLAVADSNAKNQLAKSDSLTNQQNDFTVYYDLDKSLIRKDAVIVLNEVIATLGRHHNAKFLISSFADTRGTDKHNYKLSIRRSNSVVDWLLTHGIDKSHLITKSFGDRQPTNGCLKGVKCSEEDYQLNRRTAINISRL